GEDIGVDMSMWKYFSYTYRQGINQEAPKYRWTGNEIQIKIQLRKKYRSLLYSKRQDGLSIEIRVSWILREKQHSWDGVGTQNQQRCKQPS
ncbi:MAG: hypothetical protein EZS28_047308, partial [Streblomastix strix]